MSVKGWLDRCGMVGEGKVEAAGLETHMGLIYIVIFRKGRYLFSIE